MVLTHRVRLLALCTLARAASGVRSVLVTGANKGIGRAIVQKIVEDYDVDEKALRWDAHNEKGGRTRTENPRDSSWDSYGDSLSDSLRQYIHIHP